MGHLKTGHFLLNSCTNFCIFCKQQNLISLFVLICNKNLVWPSGILHEQACSIDFCMQLESRKLNLILFFKRLENTLTYKNNNLNFFGALLRPFEI